MLWKAVGAALAAYVAFTVVALYQVVVPSTCKPGQHCVTPHFARDQPLDIYVFTSAATRKRVTTKAAVGKAIARFSGIMPQEHFSEEISFTPPRVIYENKTVYAHIFITKAGQSIVPDGPGFDKNDVLYTRAPLTRRLTPRQRGKLLLEDEGVDVGGQPSAADAVPPPCNHIRRDVTLMYVPDDQSYDIRELPVPLHVVRYQTYHPVATVSGVLVARNGWRELSEASSEDDKLTFKFTFRPTSMGLYRLVAAIDEGMKHLSTTLGFSDKELDDVKALFLNNSLTVLCFTYAVTLLHIVFDYLAFKNDIGFWRGRKDLGGLSRRAVVFNSVATVIIFVYLLDSQQTSLLILGVTAFSVVVEAWKVTKVLGTQVVWRGWRLRLQAKPQRSQHELQTDQYDAMAVRYLGVALVPLSLGFAVYSLLYTPHRSWWSWAIASLANGVYMFGFIFMTPQLFINYKLKSVAHLPWRALMYKAFNTFIDDVFSFVIHMPTAHRLACLRDDVVFVVYLYQRWLYPVDYSRVNEFGYSYEAAGEQKERQATDACGGGEEGQGGTQGEDRENEEAESKKHK